MDAPEAAAEVNCSAAKVVALHILTAPKLLGKVYLEGGLVPWVITGNDSGRLHGDVDFSVRLTDMPAVRSWLDREGLYRPELDSLLIPCNVRGADFGIHALIDGVMASFCPFEAREGTIIQRNALHASFAGYDALLEATVEGLAEEDFVELRNLSDTTSAGFSTLEACRAAKVASNRPKDLVDIAEIDRIGYDRERLERVAEAFSTMRVECPAHSE